MEKHQITYTQAIDGFLLAARARQLSPWTIKDYTTTYRKFLEYLDQDPPLASITHRQVESFLAGQPVSQKTIRNYHAGLSALWTWALAEGIVDEHTLHKVPRPKRVQKAIVPYTLEDIKAMLHSLEKSKPYTRPGKRESSHRLALTERNRAILLLLVDTGIRSNELCQLKIHQADLKNRRIHVLGKGSKDRNIPCSPRTGQALWRYLATRPKDRADNYLFVTQAGHPLNIHSLNNLVKRIGSRAGVEHPTVHRFRHTFAINYLRNGGDPWSLQMILGHSTLEMVKNYLAIAQADLDHNHTLASPVANWKL